MTELEKELTIKVKRLEDDCKAYNFTQHTQQEKIKELETQIEKMKCCGNCENRYGQEKCADCHNYSKWKFKQVEQFYEEIVD